MSDGRTIDPLPGTIFSDPAEPNSARHQRRCGLLYLHGINPGAVAKDGAWVESLGDGKVRVHYEAIYVPPDKDEWPKQYAGHGLSVPSGVDCDHGGYDNRHKVKQMRHFDASLSEVL